MCLMFEQQIKRIFRAHINQLISANIVINIVIDYAYAARALQTLHTYSCYIYSPNIVPTSLSIRTVIDPLPFGIA